MKHRINLALLSAFVLASALMLAGCGGDGGEDAADKGPVNVAGNGIVADFSIDNPYGWSVTTEKVESLGQTAVVDLVCRDKQAQHDDLDLVGLSISIEELPSRQSAEAYANEYYEFDGLDKTITRPIKPVTLQHESGWSYQYTFSMDGIDSVVDMYYFNRDNAMYVVFAATTKELYESHTKPKFEAMMNTFDIK